MSMSVFRLMELHRKLDDQIASEQKGLIPDLFRLQRLKRTKLAVKDRLYRLGLGRRSARLA
jgi:hypothetical protein